jgi:hypothetical protein
MVAAGVGEVEAPATGAGPRGPPHRGARNGTLAPLPGPGEAAGEAVGEEAAAVEAAASAAGAAAKARAAGKARREATGGRRPDDPAGRGKTRGREFGDPIHARARASVFGIGRGKGGAHRDSDLPRA